MQFEQVLPGLADRIVAQWERQSIHRQEIERSVVGSNVQLARRGQIWGGVIALVALAIAGWLLFNGHEATGIAIILAEITALAGIFIFGRRAQQAERAAKHRNMPPPSQRFE